MDRRVTAIVCPGRSSTSTLGTSRRPSTHVPLRLESRMKQRPSARRETAQCLPRHARIRDEHCSYGRPAVVAADLDVIVEKELLLVRRART